MCSSDLLGAAVSDKVAAPPGATASTGEGVVMYVVLYCSATCCMYMLLYAML